MTNNTTQVNRKIKHHLDYLVNNGKKTKSGIWQANESFKDHNMLVRRNINFTFVMEDLELDHIGADLPWAEDHFQERIGGKPTNPGETYKYWPYANFSEENDPYKDGKQFSHTYQERFWPKEANPKQTQFINKGIRYELGDLEDVINQLKDNPLTRQAYLPIFFPEDTGAVHGQRVPCTLGYYFWVQDEKLHCNYIIRSCDALRHFRNDIYLTGRLLQYVANRLELEFGELHFFIFNFHVFENDLYALKKKETKLWKILGNE